MTEADVIRSARAAARDAVSAQGEATPAVLRLVEEGLQLFPKSAALWVLRGDLIQLGPDDPTYSLNDALSSYQAALKYEPDNAEALESIGCFLDAVNNSPAEAAPYLRKAVALGGGPSAQEALAQVLEQLAQPSGQDGSAG
jgi:Tfp pilus assembly protein PilF